MNILIVDDEQNALEILTRAVTEAAGSPVIRTFTRATAALNDISDGYIPDVAFLDIEMPGMGGLEMARKLKELSPITNIIFVTGFSQYSLEAHSLYPSGYLMKPATKEMVAEALLNLRHPVAEHAPQRVRVQTFGSFEVFVDDTRLHFERSKAKELFAYLIDKNGAGCTTRELALVLFEDKEYDNSIKNQIQTFISSLTKTFAAAGAENILKRQYNSIAVDTSIVDCDYYRFLRLDVTAVNQYTGEYMSQYSWAEFRTAFMNNRLDNKPRY